MIGTIKGLDRMAVADIDGDNDLDIVASRLDDTMVAIFRNITAPPGGMVAFEPLEAVGLGNLPIKDRTAIVLANFDGDTSGPNGSGTIDIVAIPKTAAPAGPEGGPTPDIRVLLNTLVNGAHRVKLDGLNSAPDLDFRTAPAILPPMLDAIPNPLPLDEDDAEQSIQLTGIVKGRQTGPQLQISASSSAPTVVPDPTISYSGGGQATLTYQPAADAVGSAVITVRVVDAGDNGLFDDGDDGVTERNFTVTVQPVNDPPDFTLGNSITVTQKAGLQTVTDFVNNLSPGGGPDEGLQTLSGFTVNTETGLFSTPPSINSQRTLSFTPDPEEFGLAVVHVSLSDNGGTANGGRNQTTEIFVINILPVNDPPSVTIGSNLNVVADSGPQTVVNFAHSFQPGTGSDDVGQIVSDYIVSTDQPALFSVEPDIADNGTLTFTPLPAAAGTATVTVQVQDDGGRNNGGVDRSAPQTFQIIIEPANPTVEFVQIGNGAAQRSVIRELTISFDKEVNVEADAFTLTKIGADGGPVGSVTAAAANVLGRTLVRLSFDGAHTQNDSLVDGHYQLQIDGSKIISDGVMLDGGSGPGTAYVDEFFRLFGDGNGNGIVELLDFAMFRRSFGTRAGDDQFAIAFDSDHDNSIGLLDFANFRRNFGTAI